MAWNHLTPDDLKLVLAEDELQKLSTCSLADDKLSVVLQEQLDMVADAYRGAFTSKGYTVDVRDHYVPSSYKNFILNYARFEIFTRFPMTDSYALDENRKKQWEEAQKMLKDPFLGVEKPDYSDDPELSGSALSTVSDFAVTLPWLKIPAVPFDTGFAQVYPYARYWW